MMIGWNTKYSTVFIVLCFFEELIVGDNLLFSHSRELMIATVSTLLISSICQLKVRKMPNKEIFFPYPLSFELFGGYNFGLDKSQK